MKVTNMVNTNGNRVKNQFLIEDVTIKHESSNGTEALYTGSMFQSYNSNIAFIDQTGSVLLDSHYWNYSVTTGKYRNIFLGENKKETEKKIEDGTYILTNLN